MSEATTAGSITKCKAVFNHAVRIGWLEKSPLDGVGRGSFINRTKDRYITKEEYLRLLEHAPCSNWRVIIALARYGGLRAPCEIMNLQWKDIHWEYPGRFYVVSPKTSRYKGHEGRLVPLFPEVEVELKRLLDDSSRIDSEYVITRYRRRKQANLGTQFDRIAQRAGVEPFQKPFNNMRASRASDIYNEFGPYYESKWIGHNPKVAINHYLQIREVDFERAVSGHDSSVTNSPLQVREEFTEQMPENTFQEVSPESKAIFPGLEKSFPGKNPGAYDVLGLHGVASVFVASSW